MLGLILYNKVRNNRTLKSIKVKILENRKFKGCEMSCFK